MRTHQVQAGVGQRVLALHRVSVKRAKQDVDPQLTGGELVNGAVFEGEVQFVQATSGRARALSAGGLCGQVPRALAYGCSYVM